MEICSQELPRIENYPVFPARCIDLNLINELINKKLIIKKTPISANYAAARKAAISACTTAVTTAAFIVTPHTKMNALKKIKRDHDAESPILLGELPKHAQVIERNINTLANDQLLLI